MALRDVARRVGVPALRRALGFRVSPSATSGPLASRSSQAGYSNGAGQKRSSQELMEKLAKSNASFSATADAIARANRMRKIELRMYMGSAALSVCLAWYMVESIYREVRALTRKIALERAVIAREEEMDEADMEGDKKEQDFTK